MLILPSLRPLFVFMRIDFAFARALAGPSKGKINMLADPHIDKPGLEDRRACFVFSGAVACFYEDGRACKFCLCCGPCLCFWGWAGLLILPLLTPLFVFMRIDFAFARALACLYEDGRAC